MFSWPYKKEDEKVKFSEQASNRPCSFFLYCLRKMQQKHLDGCNMPINYAAVVKAADAIVMLRCPACTALCGGLAEGTYRTVCR